MRRSFNRCAFAAREEEILNEPIPFNRPTRTGSEEAAIAQVFASGHLHGDGVFTKRCSAHLERVTGAKRALLTTSCTHALEMTALLLDMGPGDEFIVPSFTFVSTVNAFALRGARPVFVDIRRDTLNLDETKVAAAITARTKAILIVHYAGVAAELNALARIANENGIPLIEDNAHGLFGAYDGRPLGSFGTLATQSFHDTKNVTCGEGGALLINDGSLIERAEIVREKGTNRQNFLRGEVDKYTWVEIGSSYLPSEILAAVLYEQLEHADEIQAKRKHAWEFYFTRLREWALREGASLPHVPPECSPAYHLFYVLFAHEGRRDAAQEYLRANRISATFHYIPLHSAPRGRKLTVSAPLPQTDACSSQLLRLPFFTDIADEQLERVCSTLESFTSAHPSREKVAAS